MKEQVAVENLAHGMFVVELDRPWLETQFLIQGFVIDSQEQIAELQHSCKYVFVERSLSLGDQFQPDVVEKPVAQRTRTDPDELFREKKDAPGQPQQSLLRTLLQIVRSAFSTAPRTQAPTRARAQSTRAEEPRVIIVHEDKPENAAAPRAMPVRREKEISEEERDHLERAKDPAATVTIYAEKEPPARAGFLVRFLRLFRVSAEPRQHADPAIQTLEAAGYADEVVLEEELPMAVQAHEKAQLVLEEIIADLTRNKALDLEKVEGAVGWMVQSVVRNPDGMIWLARLKSVDARTYEHGINSAIYLIAFGRHLNLPEAQLQVVGTVGLMQDIGKLKLPQALLDKREKPTAAELTIFQSHVAHSIAILSTSSGASQTLIDAVHEHHERHDGSGYPRGIRGEEISMLGGMAGLVDTYTAMIGTRPYAPPVSVQQALHDLYAMRNQAFKAELVEQFIQCVGVYPVGSLVELNTSEIAVVVSQNRTRRLKPRVMLALDSNRQPFAKPVLLELFYDPPTPAGEPYRIVRGLQAGLYDYDPQYTLDVLMKTK